jgi:CO/xanthine dehydrogenase FAD-binding subunit
LLSVAATAAMAAGSGLFYFSATTGSGSSLASRKTARCFKEAETWRKCKHQAFGSIFRRATTTWLQSSKTTVKCFNCCWGLLPHSHVPFGLIWRLLLVDLHTVERVRRPARAEEIVSWEAGCAWLAGGTWLFSEPQIDVHTLIDLQSLQWSSLQAAAGGLEIASTCTVAEFDRFAEKAPTDWTAAALFRLCSRSFLASYKIWNEATVGGNICMSLPAGPMISLAAALEGVCTLWPRSGEPRQVSVVDFVTGNHRNVLAPGELLRLIFLPAHALRKKFAFRRFTLTHLGRSEVLLIGTRCPAHGEFLLTITAATLHPVQLSFAGMATAEELKRAIDDAVPFSLYLDDAHGSPAHRQHLTYYFAEQIRAELGDAKLANRNQP